MFRKYWEIIRVGFIRRFLISTAVVVSFTIAQLMILPPIIRGFSNLLGLVALVPFVIFCLPTYFSRIKWGLEIESQAKVEVPIQDEYQSLADQFGMKIKCIKIVDGLFNAGAKANGKIILGTLLLKNFDLARQKAVLAHELAHIKRKHHLKLLLALTVVLPYAYLSSSNQPQFISILIVYAWMLYLMVPIQWLSEFDADECASKIVGIDNMIATLEAFPGDPNEGSDDHPPIAIRIKRLKTLSKAI